ncbi:hypothetical protein OG230_19365 [Streptomyces sp. NBC_00234]|uniref:hypothetical protein n=1 Tax=Streptomyces sp. NBC_00234 TaxID=2903638 RepID=UPI002E29475A|nr:hypothetical protein [Streptomyces sp. NBC_00234]
MNDSSDTATGPAGLALPLALATEMAARKTPGRAHEISAVSDPTGRKRRAARRRAMAVRG